MAQSFSLAGSQIKVYFGGQQLKEIQSMNYTVDYGEQAIYGVDSSYPQEIAVTQVSVKGSFSIVYIQGNMGLQGSDIRSRIQEILYAPYVALRISNIKTSEDIAFFPQTKVTQESMSISAKGVVKITAQFTSIIPYMSGDLN
jgi:hypothetical protein